MTFIHIHLDSVDPCEEGEGDGERGECFGSVHWLHVYEILALKQILSHMGRSRGGRR